MGGEVGCATIWWKGDSVLYFLSLCLSLPKTPQIEILSSVRIEKKYIYIIKLGNLTEDATEEEKGEWSGLYTDDE